MLFKINPSCGCESLESTRFSAMAPEGRPHWEAIHILCLKGFQGFRRAQLVGENVSLYKFLPRSSFSPPQTPPVAFQFERNRFQHVAWMECMRLQRSSFLSWVTSLRLLSTYHTGNEERIYNCSNVLSIWTLNLVPLSKVQSTGYKRIQTHERPFISLPFPFQPSLYGILLACKLMLNLQVCKETTVTVSNTL